MDISKEATEQTIQEEIDLIITHHPFFFDIIKKIYFNSYDEYINEM